MMKLRTIAIILLLAGIASAGGTSYVYGPNGPIAKINESGAYYYHSDHLGSTSAMTDEDGEVLEEQVNLPFGELIFGSEKYGFTGKERDETGLQYFGARFYDSNSGRFLTVDPALQDFSSYGYVGGNPLTRIDPDGRLFFLAGCSRGPDREEMEALQAYHNDPKFREYTNNKYGWNSLRSRSRVKKAWKKWKKMNAPKPVVKTSPKPVAKTPTKPAPQVKQKKGSWFWGLLAALGIAVGMYEEYKAESVDSGGSVKGIRVRLSMVLTLPEDKVELYKEKLKSGEAIPAEILKEAHTSTWVKYGYKNYFLGGRGNCFFSGEFEESDVKQTIYTDKTGAYIYVYTLEEDAEISEPKLERVPRTKK